MSTLFPASLPDDRAAQSGRRRAATRERIVHAALAVCAAHLNTRPTVEHIVERARVSRGTFYKYFDSVDDALAAAGQDLTRRALLEGERFRSVFSEKWKSTAVVLRVVLTRALLDPAWARFVLQSRAFAHDEMLASIVLQDLAEGRRSGEYNIRDDQVALDVLRALLQACIEALHKDGANPTLYIDGAVHLWLQALGCERSLCDAGVQMSAQFIAGYVSGELEPLLSG